MANRTNRCLRSIISVHEIKPKCSLNSRFCVSTIHIGSSRSHHPAEMRCVRVVLLWKFIFSLLRVFARNLFQSHEWILISILINCKNISIRCVGKRCVAEIPIIFSIHEFLVSIRYDAPSIFAHSKYRRGFSLETPITMLPVNYVKTLKV